MRVSASKVTLILLAILIFLAAWQSRRLAAVRRADMPDAYIGYAADVPPALNFVMAGLGGFRGLVAEMLWFRVSTLQEQGRFIELVQLSDWITLLDPHAAEAWAYNAWNLAYNVSIVMVRPEDRLRWVLNGIALLRDKGLRFNPREAKLYRELAWLYQNKIGDSLDSAHLTYKLALANQMAPFLLADGTVNASLENRPHLAALQLDPDRMLALEKRFGPLDWRVAETHAIYWACRGQDFALGADGLLCRRSVYQPLMLSVLRGRFTGDLANKQWKATCNLALALPAADYLTDTLAKFPSKNMTVVYLRYLTLAVQLLSKNGQPAQARTLYERLLSALPPQLAKPTFDEVVKGWEHAYEKP